MFPFSAFFVSSAGFHPKAGQTQHLLRLKLRVAKRTGRVDPRGLETHAGPHTGLLMTSDVACARPLSPGSGEGQPIPGTRVRGEGESGRPIIGCSLPDLWLLIVGSWRSTAHA